MTDAVASKNVIQSKTMWASAAIAALSVAQSYMPALTPMLDQQTVTLVGCVIAAGLAGLRVFIGTPLTVMPVVTAQTNVTANSTKK
jgi:predicted membrane-bound dolichyl-phosphate-mannose-protein mannosyltransferase